MPANEAQIENIHVRDLTPLLSPNEVKAVHPATFLSVATVADGRVAIHNIMERSTDDRLLVMSGPCSINDTDAALEYASWLNVQRKKNAGTLEIMMRMYFEKPRTTVGWKGLINDPNLDKSYDINKGLLIARRLATNITMLGMPVGSELLDTMTPQYFGGLLSWGAIGARTTESQLHRELASGLSFPVGFKNGTGGNIDVAIDAVSAATHPHRFLAITNDGQAAIAQTSGNPDCHVVLRGGSNGPNYSIDDIFQTTTKLAEKGLLDRVMIDTSHANSGKDHTRQIEVVREVSRQIKNGSIAVFGVMIESNLVEGAQPFNPGGTHEYGKSITDACVGLNETEDMFGIMAEAVISRRQNQ
jgi:3-deoxy-7-phosphoheptulonate synthase